MKGEGGGTVSQTMFIKRLAATIIVINLLVCRPGGSVIAPKLASAQEAGGCYDTELSQVLERYIGGFIDKIDVALLAVPMKSKNRARGSGGTEKDLNRFIARQHARLPELDGLRMANAQGDITCGTGLEKGRRGKHRRPRVLYPPAE